MGFTRSDITIISDNNPVKGWLYRPTEDPQGAGGTVPGLVMAHGFSGVKEIGLERYAERFAEAGIAVLVFDHPCFGASGGSPRQEVNPERQLRAYRDAITWLQGVSHVDPQRIAVWGTSFSGGHAVVLAAVDDRIVTAVAQVPYLAPPVDDIPDELATILLDDEENVARGADPITIPVVTPETDGSGALSPDPEAWGFFESWRASAPSWRNEVTVKSIARLIAYRPIERAAEVRVPVLMIASRNDVLAPFDLAEHAFEAMPEGCDMVSIYSGHFSVYDEAFDLVIEAELGWLSQHLGLEA